MPTVVYIATSLDGYIAEADGSLDWLFAVPNPEGSDYGFAEFMADVDALVMGRRTFETVVGFGEWIYDKPVFVLSETMGSVPAGLEGKAEIVRGEPQRVIDFLQGRGLTRLYVDGGRVVQSFLREDLIDELIITRIPVLLGAGIPLFGELENALWFSHQGTEILNDELTRSRYVRNREAEPA